MKTHEINVLPTAREDIADIYFRIALNNPAAALALAKKIKETIDSLAEFPERCPMIRDGELAKQGYRMLVIGGYIAFYRVFESEVLVYRVLHGKRNYPQLLN